MRQKTVRELREQGCTVGVTHKRWYFIREAGTEIEMMALLTRKEVSELTIEGNEARVLANGGYTEVAVTFVDGSEVAGAAKCNHIDQYSSRIGLDIALGRALLPQEEKERRELMANHEHVRGKDDKCEICSVQLCTHTSSGARMQKCKRALGHKGKHKYKEEIETVH